MKGMWYKHLKMQGLQLLDCTQNAF